MNGDRTGEGKENFVGVLGKVGVESKLGRRKYRFGSRL